MSTRPRTIQGRLIRLPRTVPQPENASWSCAAWPGASGLHQTVRECRAELRRAISLINISPRTLSRRTFSSFDMVRTSSPHRPGRLQSKGKHLGQFSTRKKPRLLVNFQRASTAQRNLHGRRFPTAGHKGRLERLLLSLVQIRWNQRCNWRSLESGRYCLNWNAARTTQ